MSTCVIGGFKDENDRTTRYVDELIDPQQNKLKNSSEIKNEVSIHSLPKFEHELQGKVRNVYFCENCVVILTTDRLSAFDRKVCEIPFKGKVLNKLSVWWFRQTKNIVPNYFLGSPHSNIIVGRKCEVFPVEFVMRGYITGSTATSLWTNYAQGKRSYCGHQLVDGLIKNQKLDASLLTPTTKSDEHDTLISADEIVSQGLMSQDEWNTCTEYAHRLFAHGQAIARSRGLILVDTKYEFGVASDGEILLVDELHTPDSSRYWVAETYVQRMQNGEVC
jgi:phosphoribosylaminoimidazole-succinocarboxamide synthase